jgi:hypothetical protein
MTSKATTVDQYLADLPEDRRKALEAVRQVILKNLDKDYEEGIQYGMIGYYVPHRVYPAGYHCDPKQPLPFANLASQIERGWACTGNLTSSIWARLVKCSQDTAHRDILDLLRRGVLTKNAAGGRRTNT